MLFQINEICFNESYNATLDSVMRRMAPNGAKMMQKLLQ